MTRFFRIVIPLYICVALLLPNACKKNEDDEDGLPYLSGLQTDVPQYLNVSQDCAFSAYGITTPEDGVTYKWTATGFSPDSIDTQSFICKAPATAGTYTVSVVASHSDYRSASTSQSVVVIDTLYFESISGLIRGTDSIMDTRDNQKYYTRVYGNLEWFVQNLNWAGAGNPYAKQHALAIPLGRLYSWDEATGGLAAAGLGQGPQGVCPQGWSVPTNADWEDFAAVINSGSPVPFLSDWTGLADPVCAYAKLNNAYMWPYSPRNLKSNTAAWNGLPGGNSTNSGNNYSNYGTYGFWWSSSQLNDSNAYYRYINYDLNQFPYHNVDKATFGASVRCVRLVTP